MSKKLKILMLAAEAAPFVKVGGLGDVVGSLPKALYTTGCDVRVMVPLYSVIDRKKFPMKKVCANIEVPSGMDLISVNVWQSSLPGSRVPIYFIENEKYFGGGVYGGKKDAEKFLFFSYAALFVLPALKFIPDVVHCHDSHTGLVPDIIKSSGYAFLQNIKTVYTIHNFLYQGKTDEDVLKIGNLRKSFLRDLQIDALDGDINYTVQGVLGADVVNTVSKEYSHEILTKYYGAHLDNIIKKRRNDLYGVVNGIDVDFFHPGRDKSIFRHYSIRSLDKKKENKIALQKRLGLPVDASIPILGMVSRLAGQKGLDLFTERFMKLPGQFVFLGTGERECEKSLRHLAKKYPTKVSANICFDADLAQQIYAASDIFLMPSRFEPCGLGQMIAMRYGTIPVVRATGGLDDTVDESVGFKFIKMSTAEFYRKLKEAIGTYLENPQRWRKMQEECMQRDFSWKKSAQEYMKIYRKAIDKKKV